MGLRSATMATTDTTLTLARPTVTTGLTGSRAAFSSAPVLGMDGAEAGEADGAAAGVAATTDEEATAGAVVAATTVAQDMVDAVMLGAVTLAADTRAVGSEVTRSTAAASMAAAAFTVVEAVGSTVEAVDTAAAGIGNQL